MTFATVASGLTLGNVAAGVGIAAGAKTLLGGSSGGGGAGDPYRPYRKESALQLRELMRNPATAMSQPGYQQQLQEGEKALMAGQAATGQLDSGREKEALVTFGQQSFSSYYNQMLANLMQLSGASQNPSAANLASQQASAIQQSQMMGGAQTLAGGLAGLGKIYSNPNPVGGMSSGGYGTPVGSGSGADYGSWMSGQGITPIQNF